MIMNEVRMIHCSLIYEFVNGHFLKEFNLWSMMIWMALFNQNIISMDIF